MMECQFYICLLDDLILHFVTNVRQERGGTELALTITLVLQAKRLTKRASLHK